MLKQWAFPLIHIPLYSLNSDLPLSLGHVILFGWLRLDLGITSRIEDFLFHQRAESISLWYSQSSYSLIEIIIVSGYHIQEIGPWRWRLKTIYAPCCSRGADMLCLPREMVWWWEARRDLLLYSLELSLTQEVGAVFLPVQLLLPRACHRSQMQCMCVCVKI